MTGQHKKLFIVIPIVFFGFWWTSKPTQPVLSNNPALDNAIQKNVQVKSQPVDYNIPLTNQPGNHSPVDNPQANRPDVDCKSYKSIEPVNIGFMQSAGPPYQVSFSWWDSKRLALIKQGKKAFNNPSIVRIQQLLADSPLGSAFVDVGANVGFMTFSGAAQGHPTFAIDPISYNVAKLCEGIAANVESGAFKEDMVHVFHAAAGADSKSQIKMTRPANDVGYFDQSSLARTAVHQQKVTTETIPMVTVDEVVGNVSVGVVKIDVQGFEYGVMQGMKKVLKQQQPKYVFYEEDPGMIRQAGFTPGASKAFVESYGYRCKQEGADFLCTFAS